MSVVMCRIAKVDKDRLGVTDVQEAIWLRREPSEDFSFRPFKVLLSPVLVLLRIAADLVQFTQETFLENCLSISLCVDIGRGYVSRCRLVFH